jgi:uncharacterized membrane protein
MPGDSQATVGDKADREVSHRKPVPSQPIRRHRMLVCVALGILAAISTWRGNRPARTDIDETWYTSRAFLRGQNPYIVGDSLYRSAWKYPLIYPGTAVLVTAPFATVPLPLAQALWSGLGTAGLAWVLTRRGWWGLFALGSAPFITASFLVQWSPLLLAGLIPGLGFLWAAKPTIGAALFVGWPSKSAAIGGALLTLLSFVLIPGWPAQMLARLPTAPHIIPIITRPGGVLLLLALIRWRQPEARMLAALAVIPHTVLDYEMLPLFLIPRTPREMAALTLSSQVAYALAFTSHPGVVDGDLGGMIAGRWPYWLVLVYLPALVLVLRRRGVAA